MRNSSSSQVIWSLGRRPTAASIATDAHSVSILAALVFSFLLLPYAVAQLYTGSIAGTVTDPSGAVIASARVDATDQDKGFSFNATTDSAGRYLIRQLSCYQGFDQQTQWICEGLETKSPRPTRRERGQLDGHRGHFIIPPAVLWT